MILRKLLISISLMLAGSMTTAGFANDIASQKLSLSSWSPATQFSLNSLGINSDVSFNQQSSLFQINPLDAGINDANQWTLDIKHRMLSATENTYLAMGLGWNDIALQEGEVSSGMRFVAEGRVGIYGPAYLFGQAALSPWMTDAGSNLAPFGKELKFGLAINPLPSMSFRAGYRSYWLDTTSLSEDTVTTSQSDGFYIGGGFHW